MMDSDVHDVVIVGAGLTGAWAAKQLSQAGLRVLLLEAGPELSCDVVNDGRNQTAAERRLASKRQPIQSQHPDYWRENPALFVDDLDHPYSTTDAPFYWIRGRQVGGRSLTWGGVTLRFSDHELCAWQQDGYGPCWPIRYADLAGSYERIERYLGVAGSADGLSTLPDGAFVTPSALTPSEMRLRHAVQSRWADRHVVHCRGIPQIAANETSGVGRWPTKSIQNRVLPDAMRTGRTVVRPDTIVSHLIMNPHTGRAAGLCCIHRVSKEMLHIAARVVVLCASTIESVRILLNSRNERYPGGIGNSSGLLGRFLLDHAVVWAAGTTPQGLKDNQCVFGGADGVLIPRFRNVVEPAEDFLRGYGIWGGVGRWQADARGRETWWLCAMLEVLPRSGNRVEIAEDRFDAWGIHSPSIRFSYGANEERMCRDAESVVSEMVQMLGWQITQRGRLAAGRFVHETGGARMGTDASSSVLTPFNQCWDVRNLFVLDGSCFVTSGWQNPTLTMMAIADRACAFIVREISSGQL